MKILKKLMILLVLAALIIGCSKEPENNYLGNLKVGYTMKLDDKEVPKAKFEFFYGRALTKYLNQYYSAFSDEDVYKRQKQELLLILVGGVFLMETLSVIIQVVSFKTRGKRVFKMAPIHHHFEMLGWSEQQVTISFWFIGFICGILSIVIGVL